MAKTSPEKLAAALRANLARRKGLTGRPAPADDGVQSPNGSRPQKPAPDSAPKPASNASPRAKPA
jgi:hypothetical protein